jgi:hypothetical protein
VLRGRTSLRLSLQSLGKGEGLFAYKTSDTDIAPLQNFFHRIIFLTIRYGDRMRASTDVGFPTMENN